jgi:PKD repeat protein
VFTATYTNLAPVAIADASPQAGFNQHTVTFTGTASYDPDASALSYRWEFGDGQGADLPNITHAYGLGQYAAALTVTDTIGLSNTTWISISVSAGIWLPFLRGP